MTEFRSIQLEAFSTVFAFPSYMTNAFYKVHKDTRLSIRQQKIAQHLRQLQRVADEFNIPVIVTNQMSADPGAVC